MGGSNGNGDRRIERGASEGDIARAGGYVDSGNRVYDQHGHRVWTKDGDLSMKNGTAEPERKPEPDRK